MEVRNGFTCEKVKGRNRGRKDGLNCVMKK
jgi:hypothetical protein